MTQTTKQISSLLQGLSAFMLLSISSLAFAAKPILAFSDLISGPDTGLGDGLGSGVIVTVWGQHLGSSQGTSVIEYCDSASVCRAGHVYYWKNADGELPSGPANLYESHGMQEIAFSIPDSAMGMGTIRVRTGTDQTTLPFTVRTGNIYHVSPSGNNSNPGTFAQPWQTQERVGHTQSGGTTAPAGSTVYFHGVNSGNVSATRGIYINNTAATAPNAITNFFITSYPGTQSVASGREGFTNYQIAGTAISKFRIYSSNCDEGANGQAINCITGVAGSWGILTDKWGRAVANFLTEQPGRCSSIYQGAIYGNAQYDDNVSGAKMFGNEIEEYGCYGSSPLHHTTYLTVRSAPKNTQVDAWEWGWNYLHDNHTKGGLHQFDQDDACGDLIGSLIIRNNVIVNQAGPGIDVASQCGWSMDAYIENNIVINAGRSVQWDGLDPNTGRQLESGAVVIRDSGMPPQGGLTGTMYIRNNTFQGVGWDGMPEEGQGCLSLTGSGDSVSIVFSDNVCVNTWNYPYVGFGFRSAQQADNIKGGQNVFYFTGTGSAPAIPLWDAAAITTNPLIEISLPRVSVRTDSAIIELSSTILSRDIYGVPRSSRSSLGAVTYLLLHSLPSPPPSFSGTPAIR